MTSFTLHYANNKMFAKDKSLKSSSIFKKFIVVETFHLQMFGKKVALSSESATCLNLHANYKGNFFVSSRVSGNLWKLFCVT